MEDSADGAQFLKRKYDFHNAPEVDQAVRRTFMRTGERVPQDPLLRIQNYLSRFTEITDREDSERRQHGVAALKRVLHTRFIIKPTDIPESALLLEQRIARELGHGDVEITDDFREQKTQQIITDQTRSLDKWVDYLSSDDAEYPDWAKYWTLRSVVAMGKLEKRVDDAGKETARFTRRSKDTVAPFPSLNPRALALTIGSIRSQLEQKRQPKNQRHPAENKSVRLDDSQFQQLLSTEDFARLYTQFLIELPEYSTEGLQETRGRWVTYPQGSDPTPLSQSLEGYPLEWCTASVDTARTQLQGGDFHVYYSIDKDGNPIVPRLAIRMEGNSIAEFRGIAPGQNLDPYVAPIVERKLEEFPDGKAYQKKVADMKHLTEIDHKMQSGAPLDASELVFLYEVDSPIQGFGYGYSRDPRIEELRNQRNPELDMLVVFGCEPSQIAHNLGELRPDTRAYIGPLVPGIFDRLQEYNIEHVYTSFPEGKIRRQSVEIGGKTKEQLLSELEQAGVYVTSYAEDMINSPDFTTLPIPQTLHTVRLKVGDLGLSGNPTTGRVYRKMQELGLDLCPAEVGPHMRLATKDQPLGDYYWIVMKQITDSDGYPNVFRLVRYEDGLWSDARWAGPGSEWNPDDEFVFSLRRLET
ncbi:MAG: hypothetical protein UZ21_OP11001000430 [Microgenomates bacterium OLB22]|nr:MAG: hypothetical protein UZ21_OP11001000430 [Microgenomates bacterium OLB22]